MSMDSESETPWWIESPGVATDVAEHDGGEAPRLDLPPQAPTPTITRPAAPAFGVTKSPVPLLAGIGLLASWFMGWFFGVSGWLMVRAWIFGSSISSKLPDEVTRGEGVPSLPYWWFVGLSIPVLAVIVIVGELRDNRSDGVVIAAGVAPLLTLVLFYVDVLAGAPIPTDLLFAVTDTGLYVAIAASVLLFGVAAGTFDGGAGDNQRLFLLVAGGVLVIGLLVPVFMQTRISNFVGDVVSGFDSSGFSESSSSSDFSDFSEFEESLDESVDDDERAAEDEEETAAMTAVEATNSIAVDYYDEEGTLSGLDAKRLDFELVDSSIDFVDNEAITSANRVDGQGRPRVAVKVLSPTRFAAWTMSADGTCYVGTVDAEDQSSGVESARFDPCHADSSSAAF